MTRRMLVGPHVRLDDGLIHGVTARGNGRRYVIACEASLLETGFGEVFVDDPVTCLTCLTVGFNGRWP